MGDRRRERESPARGERCSGLRYGENARTVHWCSCDWPDLQVDRTVRMNGGLIGCDAVHRNLGTPGDVAQQDQSLDYFKG